jgi:hypothetical protein
LDLFSLVLFQGSVILENCSKRFFSTKFLLRYKFKAGAASMNGIVLKRSENPAGCGAHMELIRSEAG